MKQCIYRLYSGSIEISIDAFSIFRSFVPLSLQHIELCLFGLQNDVRQAGRQAEIYMKKSQFNRLGWGSLRLTPIIIYEKSQLNTLVWGTLMLAPNRLRCYDKSPAAPTVPCVL